MLCDRLLLPLCCDWCVFVFFWALVACSLKNKKNIISQKSYTHLTVPRSLELRRLS